MTQKVTLVGIDVSKDKVDVALRSAGATAVFVDSREGRADLLRWISQHGVSKAVMEATGGYEQRWARLLTKAGVEVVIVDPKRVRHFARSAGRLAKNDAIDAEMIAWFGEVFDELIGKPHDEARQQLEQLVTAHQTLVRLQGQIQSWGEHEQPKLVQNAHRALLKAVAAQLDKISAALSAQVKANPQFARTAEIIESVPGLGEVSAWGVIAFHPELGRVDRQAAAALLGAAPFDDDSGKRSGARHITGGRKKLRKLLYMPVMGAATRHNPVLNAYYERLLAKGKLPKVAIIACMRKLIGILNAMLARGEKWDATKHAIA
jgi:transposase